MGGITKGQGSFKLHGYLKRLFARPYAPAWVACSVPILALPIAVFAPVDVLSQHPGLMSFVSVLERWFPVILDLSLPTDFPQVARLYYSAILALSPLWFYCLLLSPEERTAPLEYIRKNKRWYPFVLIPFLLLLLWFIFFHTRVSPQDRLPGIMSLTQHSRLLLSLLGGACMQGFVMALYFFVVWVKWIPRLYCQSNNSK